jgi:hypothetical protein
MAAALKSSDCLSLFAAVSHRIGTTTLGLQAIDTFSRILEGTLLLFESHWHPPFSLGAILFSVRPESRHHA